MRSRQALHRIFLPVLLGLLPFALRAQARFDEAYPGRCSYPTVGTRLVFGTLP